MAETKKTTKKVEEKAETETSVKPAAKKTTTRKTTAKKTSTTSKTKKETKVKEVKEEVKTETVENIEKAPKTKKETKAEAKETKKMARAAKKAEKAEAKKPVVKSTISEAHAKAIGVKCTPRKARLVIDLVRGKDCDEALGILNNVNHKACRPVAKLIKSAMSNATNNFNMNEDKLYVAAIQASDGIKMRRYLPRAKGSASGLVKRFCNIFVTVKERN